MGVEEKVITDLAFNDGGYKVLLLIVNKKQFDELNK